MQSVEVALPEQRRNARRVAVSTLGCKVNAFESELIAQSLGSDSWNRVNPRETADLYVINTCTVTREADRQARQEVRRVIRQNPDAMVVVTGCYAQLEPAACTNIPGVDLVVGNASKLDIHTLLPKFQRGEVPQVLVDDLDEHISLPSGLLTGFDGHTRAFVQVQQGCNQGCTFCIIHQARGPSRSLAPTLIKHQVERLLLNGYKEIVICGVDLGSYGEDTAQTDEPRMDLTDLLGEIVQTGQRLGAPFRIRLSSLDPAHLTDKLIRFMAEQPEICPHLHLSLQSANSLILKRMKRRYGRELVYERIQKMRACMPDLVISADVMTGFPTESDEQFQDTLQAIDDLKIAYPHVFPYSERDGTPAARIPRQISVAERKQRARRVREAGERVQESVLARWVDQFARVLVEGHSKQTPQYLRARMDNYLPVHVPGSAKDGEWLNVVLKSVEQGALLAKTITE